MTKVITAIGILLLRGSRQPDPRRAGEGLPRRLRATSACRPRDSRPITLRGPADPYRRLRHRRSLGRPPARHAGRGFRPDAGSRGRISPGAPRLEFEYSNLGLLDSRARHREGHGRDLSGLCRAGDPAPDRHGAQHTRAKRASRRRLGRSPYRMAEDRWDARAAGAPWGLRRDGGGSRPTRSNMRASWPSCWMPGPARDDAETGSISRALRRELALFTARPRAPTFRTHNGREIATSSAYGLRPGKLRRGGSGALSAPSWRAAGLRLAFPVFRRRPESASSASLTAPMRR